MGGSQFTMTLWMGYTQTPEIENGYETCRMEAGAGSDHDGGICPGPSICYIYSGTKLGEEWLY